MKTLKDIIQAIKANKEQHATAAADLRQNKDVTPDGRARQLAALYQQSMARHRELMAALQSRKAEIRVDLARRAFSPPIPFGTPAGEATQIRAAYHQAMALADQARGREDLLRLYERAQRTGDTLGALAVAHVAFERADSTVLDRFRAANPDRGQLLGELGEFERSWGTMQGPGEKIQERILTSGPEEPHEACGVPAAAQEPGQSNAG